MVKYGAVSVLEVSSPMTCKRAVAAILTIVMLILSLPAFAAEAGYYITVDIANQIVTVYDADNKTESGIRMQAICSTGMGNSTPTGLFCMPKPKYSSERQEWYYFTEYEIWAKYASRIRAGILFHSILYTSRGATRSTWASQHALGGKASHGCVRLPVIAAKWIAENCAPGTMVYIYNDAEKNAALHDLLKDQEVFFADEQDYAVFKLGRVSITQRSKGDRVAKVQVALADLGYEVGDADGIIGSKTRAAIEAWQADNGFEADCVLTTEQQKLLVQ